MSNEPGSFGIRGWLLVVVFVVSAGLWLGVMALEAYLLLRALCVSCFS